MEQQITPREFEEYVVAVLKELGHYDIKHVGKTGDHGVDILSIKSNRIHATQVKLVSSPIGEPIIRDLAGSMKAVRADVGLIFTNSTLTNAAETMANLLGISCYTGVRPKKKLPLKIEEIESIAEEWVTKTKKKYNEFDIISVEPSSKSFGMYEVRVNCMFKEGFFPRKEHHVQLIVLVNTTSRSVVGYTVTQGIER